MPRASAYSEEIVEIPTNVSVNKKGYVYYNADTYWTDSKGCSYFYRVFLTAPLHLSFNCDAT